MDSAKKQIIIDKQTKKKIFLKKNRFTEQPQEVTVLY